MKKLLLASAITILSVTFTPASSATNIAQNLCEYIAADDKSRMRSFLKTNKLKIRKVFDGIQCNGQNLIEFAGNKNALETGTMMIAKLPKKKVKAVMASISSAELTAAAEKRVNG